MKSIELDKEQNQFIKYLELKGKSFNTIKNYRTDLNCFNKYILEKRPHLRITELTHSEAKDYSRFLIEKYGSPNSIRRRVQALRIFFDYLIETEQIDDNPIKQVIVAPKVVEAPKPAQFKDILTLNNHLLEMIKVKQGLDRLLILRNKIIFNLIYSSGLKVSDISGLKRSNLLKSSNDSYRVMVVPAKRDPISLPLDEDMTELIDEYLLSLDKQKVKDGIEFDNLFFNSNPYSILSGNISPRGIEIIFKEFCKKLQLKITAKSLRQACIVKWLIDDTPESTVKEWMGVQPNYSLRPYSTQAKDPSFHYLKVSNQFREQEESL